MNDKNTPTPPTYKKTIDTTNFGLTCVTELGIDSKGWFHHEYTYTHNDRKALIIVAGDGSPRPADWHTRHTAYATYYENGQQVGRTRTYNILENAQIKAVQWVMGYDSDSKADEACRAMRLAKSRRNQQICRRIPKNLLMEVDGLAERLGLKIHGNEDNDTVETFVNTYLTTAENNGLIEIRNRQHAYETSITAWLDEEAGRRTEDAPDWENFKKTVEEINLLYVECNSKAAESVGLADRLK